jgi:hypothetical protein
MTIGPHVDLRPTRLPPWCRLSGAVQSWWKVLTRSWGRFLPPTTSATPQPVPVHVFKARGVSFRRTQSERG